MRGKLATVLPLLLSVIALAVSVFAYVQVTAANRREKAVVARYYPRLVKMYEKAGIKDPPSPENFSEFLIDSYVRSLESTPLEGKFEIFPKAEETNPIAKGEQEAAALILNLNDKGELLIPGREPMKDDDSISRYMNDEADRLRGTGKLDSATVGIRAHQDVKYADLVRLMDLCKRAGFSGIQLRTFSGQKD